MQDSKSGLYPENIHETSRYVLGWEYSSGRQLSNLVTFLWDATQQVWKNISYDPTREDFKEYGLKDRFRYSPEELKYSGMIIVEKVPMDFFINEKTYFNGQKEIAADGGNW